MVISISGWILPCQSFGLSNKNGLFGILQFTENDENFFKRFGFESISNSSVEQISLEFAEYKLNGNNH